MQYKGLSTLGCGKNEWRCENGPCIDVRRRCDGNIDCPFDGSDEFDCPAGSKRFNTNAMSFLTRSIKA